MRKIILITMAAIFAICVMAQQKMRVWKNHALVYEEDVTQIDSITFYDEFEGALSGEFSVSSTKKVRFSKGNLQYQASTSTWRFAENQYVCVGLANENISSIYDGWIDLFGWGTGNNPTTASTSSVYSSFTDWGTNAIINGGNEANKWRTLSKDEWIYLFYTRTNAASLFGLGRVNGVNGLIILPDNWNSPQGISFTPSVTNGFTNQGDYYYDYNGHFGDNTYTMEQWSVMEQIGAVFLIAAGDREGTVVSDVDLRGYYWSATPDITDYAYNLYFKTDYLYPQDDFYRNRGRSVRLVRDVK